MSIAFLGASGTVSDPVKLMESEVFNDRFARFINAQFNDAPGKNSQEDAVYHITKTVLETKKPWSDLFLGNYRITLVFNNVRVDQHPDGDGLGYFHTDAWMTRYEGNEEEGVKLATAYRILHNVAGLRLIASTNAPDADISSAGRQSAGCKGCHYDNWFALDKVAEVLPRKGERFDTKKATQEILGGKQVGSDKELVTALVESENFAVNACRLAFRFLYAREDNRCDGPVLDRCIDKFKAEKTIQSALASISSEEGFCQ